MAYDILAVIIESLIEYIQTLGYETIHSSSYQPYTILVFYTPDKPCTKGYCASIHCNSENIIVHTHEYIILNYEDPSLLDQIANCLILM